MDVEVALRKLGGVAKTWQLRELGISESNVRQAITNETVIRLRKGWFGLTSITPLERRAGIDHGFLTCASAATVRGFPAKTSTHYHLRANRPIENIRSGRRRRKMATVGALVSIVDMAEDYVLCQSEEWSLALVDHLLRWNHMSIADWRDLESRLPFKKRRIVGMRSKLAESALESVVRFRLMLEKIPFEMQVTVGKYRADFLIAGKVILETHGAEFHAGHKAFERDRARTLWLRGMGFDVIEMSYQQLDDWARVVSVIRAAVETRKRSVI